MSTDGSHIVWQPGDVMCYLYRDITSARKYVPREAYFAGLGLEHLRVLDEYGTILVIQSEETGFGVQGRKWSSWVLCGNRVFQIKHAHLIDDNFQRII